MSDTLNNFDKWRHFTDGLTSPDNYINFGFYYLIAASLQRRVWLGDNHMPLYPNIYCLLVGKPGIGKGILIKPIYDILQHWRLEPLTDKSKEILAATKEEQERLELIDKANYETAEKAEAASGGKADKRKTFEKPLRIPIAADATTYESLIEAMSESVRRINYRNFDPNLSKEVMVTYLHSSLCFCLEEISSLFRKRTEDLVNFLIRAYDCGDYTYKTKTQGVDIVKKCCLNFFGGTTPGFMQSTFDEKLLTEGFSARCWYIYSSANRKSYFRPPELSAQQIEYKKDIIAHVGLLTKLVGRIKVEQSTWNWLQDWWHNSQSERPNTSYLLDPYYGRKNIHVQKLAMAIHFSRSTEMSMTIEPFKEAIEMLGLEEKTMHYALGLGNANPLSKPSSKVLEYLRRESRAKSMKELLVTFYDDLPAMPTPEDTLKQIIGHLIYTNKIIKKEEEHPVTKNNMTVYTIMRESKT